MILLILSIACYAVGSIFIYVGLGEWKNGEKEEAHFSWKGGKNFFYFSVALFIAFMFYNK